MKGHTTKPYKNTFSGSVGAGMGSLISPNGRKYYILEHKVSSKYHKAGESQEIIVDNIEIGRDPHCQVRFDESFTTVSRHHAGIVKDGDMWKLVQISTTNSTFLNGHPIKTEWYLQNGDEIQLSVNGPKLGFITPTGKKSTVGSIGLTRRLSLFRQQALRPYKTAITVLSCVLVLVAGGLGTWNWQLKEKQMAQGKELAKQIKANESNKAKADSLADELLNSNKKMKDYEEKIAALSLETQKAKEQARSAIAEAAAARVAAAKAIDTGGANNTDLESQCYPYTYAIYQIKQVVKQPNGETDVDEEAMLVGTGFLLSDGRFVTARHVTETYYYFHSNWGDERINASLMYQNAVVNNGGDITTTFAAVSSSGDQITFTNKQCHVDRSQDVSGTSQLENGMNIVLKAAKVSTTDWATVRLSKTGMPFDSNLSTNLNGGTMLKVLGFPYGRGGEDPNDINPISSSAEVGRKGLDVDGTILASNIDIQSGNSGGPVVVLQDGKYIVVGVLSGSTAGKGRIVPIKFVK